VGEQGEDVVAQAKELISQGEHQAAIELLEPWLQENSDDASGWAALGAAQFQLENWTDAEKAARQAVRLRPDNPGDWCNLGTVLRKRKQVQDATQAQRRALALDPSYARARQELTKLRKLRLPEAAQPPEPALSTQAEPAAAARQTSTRQTEAELTITIQVGEEQPPVQVAFPDEVSAGPAVMSELVEFLEDPAKEWAIDPNAEELTIILLGHDWQWPGFDECRERFQRHRYFPDNWRGLEYIPDPPGPETEERLASFAGLGQTAKRVLIRLGTLTRKSRLVLSPYDVTRRTGLSPNAVERAMEEIEGLGLASTNLPLADRLVELKKDELVQVARKYAVADTGTKAQIAERLEEEVDDAALAQELPPDKREELWGIEPVFADLDDPFVEFELKRIRLLAWDVRTVISSVNRVYEASQWDEAELEVWANEQCPVCKQHVQERIPLAQLRGGRAELPPYHPGCDCEIRTAPETMRLHTTPSELEQPTLGPRPHPGASGCGALLAVAALFPLVALLVALLAR